MEDISLQDLVTISRHFTDISRYEEEIKEYAELIKILTDKISAVRLKVVTLINDRPKN